MVNYLTKDGQPVTLEGLTCNECPRSMPVTGQKKGIPYSYRKCSVSGERINLAMSVCTLYPQVMEWITTNASTSDHSSVTLADAR